MLVSEGVTQRLGLASPLEELREAVVVVGGGEGWVGAEVQKALAYYGASAESVDLRGAPSVDLSDAEQAKACFRRLREKHDRIHGFVSCVWGGPAQPLMATTPSALEESFRNTFFAAFYPVQQAVSWMQETGGGHIVLVSSINSEVSRDEGGYDYAKGALRSLTFDLLSHARQGICAVSLAPGTIGGSPSWEGKDEELLRISREIPDGRVSGASVIAHNVAWFLTSAAWPFVGHTLPMDRGWLRSKQSPGEAERS